MERNSSTFSNGDCYAHIFRCENVRENISDKEKAQKPFKTNASTHIFRCCCHRQNRTLLDMRVSAVGDRIKHNIAIIAGTPFAQQHHKYLHQTQQTK